MSKQPKKPSHLIAPLYDASAELMGLSQLIENERPDHLDLMDDEIEAKRGIGLTLRRLSEQVREYGRTLDEWTVRKGKKK
jgi:hypothetical protein